MNLTKLWEYETSQRQPHEIGWQPFDAAYAFSTGAWSFYADLYRERHFKTGDPLVEIKDGQLVCDNRSYEQMGKDEDAWERRPLAERTADEKRWEAHLYREEFDCLFHSYDEAMNAPEPKFVIENFMQEKSITLLGGPPACMKTYTALHIAKALLTDEPLFDYFQVNETSKRVVYMIPESSLAAFVARLKKLDMMGLVLDRKFLFRTFDTSEKLLGLDDPRLVEAVKGADVFLDTAVRFMDGDENASADQRIFAENLFALIKAGARTVTGLHHAPKAFGQKNEMTLENVLRGSGDIGAMAATVWGMSKIDAEKAQVYFECVKDRDFKETPKPFVMEARPHLDEIGKFKMVECPGSTRDYRSVKQGVRGKSGGRPEVECSDAQLVRVFELREVGKSLREIEEATGLSKNKVGQIVCNEKLRAKAYKVMSSGNSARRPAVLKPSKKSVQ